MRMNMDTDMDIIMMEQKQVLTFFLWFCCQTFSRKSVKRRAAQSPHAVAKNSKQTVKGTRGKTSKSIVLKQTVQNQYTTVVQPVFFAQMCPQA